MSLAPFHFLREGAVDMDDYTVWQAGRSPDEVWRKYFQTIGETARCGLFDILAHPDLVKYGAIRSGAPRVTSAATTSSRWTGSPSPRSP